MFGSTEAQALKGRTTTYNLCGFQVAIMSQQTADSTALGQQAVAAAAVVAVVVAAAGYSYQQRAER